MSDKIRRWAIGACVALGSSVVLVVITPISDYLARPLRLEAQLRPADAIVVLGGGAYKDGFPSPSSVVRAVYGLSLFRSGYAPRILLAGGRVHSESGWEAKAMKNLLEGLGAPSKILETEDRSTRTYSNATESAQMLRARGLTRILLVTHPNHMLRAKKTFEKAGFNVYPAPLPWDRLPAKPARPSLGRIGLMHNVLYEYAGLALYWWRGWL